MFKTHVHQNTHIYTYTFHLPEFAKLNCELNIVTLEFSNAITRSFQISNCILKISQLFVQTVAATYTTLSINRQHKQ